MFPWRAVARLAAWGLVCAGAVYVAGLFVADRILGGDDTAMRGRIVAEVERSFADLTGDLERQARAVADPVAVRAALNEDLPATRALFERLAQAPGVADGDLSLSVYSAGVQPLAWAGRPSELPSDRAQDGESWFIIEGALGLRLVYVVPVVEGTTRIGLVAAERELDVSGRGRAATSLQGAPEGYHLDTWRAPVSLALPFERTGTADRSSFEVVAPTGERLLSASVSPADLAATRARWREALRTITLAVVAAWLLLLAAPILDWRRAARTWQARIVASLALAALLVGARLVLEIAPASRWATWPLVTDDSYVSSLAGPFLSSPLDFLLTAFFVGGLVAVVLHLVAAGRPRRRQRRSVDTVPSLVLYGLHQALAGAVAAVVLLIHTALLRDTVAQSTLDLLRLSLPPWNGATLALQVGLVAAHAATFGIIVLLLLAGTARWRLRRRWYGHIFTIGCWVLPLVVWNGLIRLDAAEQMPQMAAIAAAIAIAIFTRPIRGRYRHGSQAFRMILLALGLVVPAVAFYPTMFHLAWQAKSRLVETRYAPIALSQRATVQAQLQESLAQIDQIPGLTDLVAAAAPPAPFDASTDRAFQIWQATSLARYPVTSSVEVYGRDGALVSRFAFNLPEDLSAAPPSEERTCNWDVAEEVSPFFAEERRILHAGRALCVGGSPGAIVGSIVVHAVLDYENLPFTSSRTPYVQVLQTTDPLRTAGQSGEDVEYAVYGWSRSPLYSSRGTAWPLDDAAFARVEQSRDPVWARLRRGTQPFDVFVLNDRGGIYALGFPSVTAFGHFFNVAELTVIAVLAYVLLLCANGVFALAGGRRTTGRSLLREVRASFYRKLFLAFVAAVFVPVVLLAIVTRTFVANEMRANVEAEAQRTATAATRVVEDLVERSAVLQGAGVDDNLMVWVSRLIDQDANIFAGARLVATSERNLFASGLLPTRANADVYRALALRREAAAVARERIGAFEYLLAAAPVVVRSTEAILTVPLTLQQREIDAQIDALDRRVLLAALLFILGGAGLGYTMAERIADPVSRLTRATGRIARGDFDVHVAATSSDELRRLVEDFNRMASELQRQRTELERTNRLEAWAEMARQVAHEIKNPLTPIQLNAEHLRRVHADRGEPLGPVLRECVETILTQVRLLRQISSEFSNFASSPTAKPGIVRVPDLVRDIVDPYRAGLGDRIAVRLDAPESLPPVLVDRTLVTRSLTNLVENALHAMPGRGALSVSATVDGSADASAKSAGGFVAIRVSDTGGGMDPEALARAFEPYFSTKATGTGLGLPIAKRNVELSGGTVAIESERERGTTVIVRLPIAPAT
ncbi:MAG TPA: HAMP domain-containing sensor histidine kinase [Vicinamibacterales bacterium]|nr:HAMP domain-containing sensor histidine kinase [Vicinamibacterales bacterium]